MKMKESGLMDFWERKYFKNDLNAPCLKSQEPQVKELSLKNLSTAFISLAAGYLISIIVVIMEHILARCNKGDK